MSKETDRKAKYFVETLNQTFGIEYSSASYNSLEGFYPYLEHSSEENRPEALIRKGKATFEDAERTLAQKMLKALRKQLDTNPDSREEIRGLMKKIVLEGVQFLEIEEIERYLGKKVVRTTIEAPWDFSSEETKYRCLEAVKEKIREEKGNRKAKYIPFSLKFKSSTEQPSLWEALKDDAWERYDVVAEFDLYSAA